MIPQDARPTNLWSCSQDRHGSAEWCDPLGRRRPVLILFLVIHFPESKMSWTWQRPVDFGFLVKQFELHVWIFIGQKSDNRFCCCSPMGESFEDFSSWWEIPNIQVYFIETHVEVFDFREFWFGSIIFLVGIVSIWNQGDYFVCSSGDSTNLIENNLYYNVSNSWGV